MSRSPFFSIIIPVYNAETTLENTIASIQAQKCSDFEVLCINDASTDHTKQTGQKLCDKDNRIHWIEQEKNLGPGAARNRGIEMASGRYVYFMDADDMIDAELLSEAKRSLERHPAQVVVFGLVEEYYDQDGLYTGSTVIRPNSAVLRTAQEIHKHVIELEKQTLYGYVWNKIYDADYLKITGCRFENMRMNEDLFFNARYMMDVTTMNILGIAPYHYRKRIGDGSNLTSRFEKDYYKLHERRVSEIYRQYKYWNALDEKVKGTLTSIYLRYILSALARNCDRRSGYGFIQRYRWIHLLYQRKLYQKLIVASKADQQKMAMIQPFFAHHMTLVLMAAGRGLFIVQKYCPEIFSKLKQRK